MSLVQPTESLAVLVAIDIAKLRHDVLLEAPGWKSRKRMILPNTAAEFRLFADYLHGLKHPVRVVFEATGNYHRPLAHFLKTEGFHLELIASLAVARTREAMHNSWDKNDPKDAQVFLHLLKSRLTQHFHDPMVHNLNDLQELSKTHHHVSLEKTRTQHRLLTHYLPLYFPEIARYRQLRATIEKRADDLLSGNQDYQRLRRIPGIGPISALTILAEAGDLRRFSHHRQFLKFCGFDLATAQSGQFRALSRLSKRGNARLRAVFWMAASVAVRMRENSFRAKFERYMRSDPGSA